MVAGVAQSTLSVVKRLPGILAMGVRLYLIIAVAQFIVGFLAVIAMVSLGYDPSAAVSLLGFSE